jgi:hypothetical protein
LSGRQNGDNLIAGCQEDPSRIGRSQWAAMKDGNTKVRLQLGDLLRNRWLRTAEYSSCPRKRTLFSHSAQGPKVTQLGPDICFHDRIIRADHWNLSSDSVMLDP